MSKTYFLTDRNDASLLNTEFLYKNIPRVPFLRKKPSLSIEFFTKSFMSITYSSTDKKNSSIKRLAFRLLKDRKNNVLYLDSQTENIYFHNICVFRYKLEKQG